MHIVITGASGNFGRLAATRLLGKLPAGELILVTRTPDRLADLAARGAQVRYGDYDDPDSLRNAFDGGKKILMISGTRVGQRVPQHTNAVNAARRAGVAHIIYTSFVAADPGNPSLAIGDHRATEMLLRESGLRWTIMRNGWYMDAIVEAAAPPALQNGRWFSSSGAGRVAPIARADCVDCAVAVLSGSGHEGRVYNLTGPELLSIREAAAIIAEIAGRPIDYVDVTDADMYAFFDGLGIPRAPVDDQVVGGVPWCSDDMVSFERTIREGYFAVLSDDVAKLTGRAPQTLRQFALERREFLRTA